MARSKGPRKYLASRCFHSRKHDSGISIARRPEARAAEFFSTTVVKHNVGTDGLAYLIRQVTQTRRVGDVGLQRDPLLKMLSPVRKCLYVVAAV